LRLFETKPKNVRVSVTVFPWKINKCYIFWVSVCSLIYSTRKARPHVFYWHLLLFWA